MNVVTGLVALLAELRERRAKIEALITARELEVCPKTIQRDLEFLQDRLQHDLQFDPSTKNWSYRTLPRETYL